MGSAAEPSGPATPQGETSADTEASPGAARSGPSAASRGGEPTSSPAATRPTGPAADSPPGPAGVAADAPPAATGPAPDAPPAAADAPAGPATDSSPGPTGPATDSSPGPVVLSFEALAADFAPESLGSLSGEPPAASEDQLREEAFNAAWRFLSRRERTEAEVRARLERNDVEAPLIDEVLDELKSCGYVDDAGYAQRFAEDRRNLDNWGAERIERRLRELGVDRTHIAAALAAGDHDELAAATALLARRYPVPPEAPRDREKALGFLVRKGFDLELAHDALRRHAASAVER
ncbi:RecX family transcriptional regulator [Solirubrobacter phytolaccae]|uniref:Regulatory protein RecX n=1 Tax=Solirubrobacter phytolaccae TaxID=1404360 RepID=A0A9X3S900_9ACTN|nr:RecX family transcriptional regulator [Solirubrobacter phytolaccae]MDA0182163.1 RecX family transcriptional regulator [Solirubrobacter phytolaccae]